MLQARNRVTRADRQGSGTIARGEQRIHSDEFGCCAVGASGLTPSGFARAAPGRARFRHLKAGLERLELDARAPLAPAAPWRPSRGPPRTPRASRDPCARARARAGRGFALRPRRACRSRRRGRRSQPAPNHRARGFSVCTSVLLLFDPSRRQRRGPPLTSRLAHLAGQRNRNLPARGRPATAVRDSFQPFNPRAARNIRPGAAAGGRAYGMIIVTGGAGFIGSNLVAGLEERGRSRYRRLRPARTRREMAQSRQARARRVHLARSAGEHPRRACRRDRDDLPSRRGILDHRARCRCHGAVELHADDAPVGLVRRASRTVHLRLFGRDLWRRRAGFDDDFSIAGLARLRPLNAYGWSKHLVDRRIARLVARGAPTPPHWAASSSSTSTDRTKDTRAT